MKEETKLFWLAELFMVSSLFSLPILVSPINWLAYGTLFGFGFLVWVYLKIMEEKTR